MNDNLRVLFDHETIQQRITELGKEIKERYQGKDLIVICVLKGGFLFFADLVRAIDLDMTLDFVRLASYGSETSSSGKVIFGKDMELSIEGRDVLIVEDIVDTGRSMHYLKDVLSGRGPSSIAICTLVDKHERREVDVEVDYFGFRLDKGFIVGYGLDYDEKYRHLKSIYEVLQQPD